MREISRRIDWLASDRPENQSELQKLQDRMSEYYARHAKYYEDIDFSADAWRTDQGYLEITRNLAGSCATLEIGCGRANVLSAHPELARSYTGIDFSETLMERNAERFPSGRFVQLLSARQLPFQSERFDRVFSTYVIEHCVFPRDFLRESLRVLRPGGLVIMVCPNFLGCGAMTSQRAGYSVGAGRTKMQNGRLFDAIVTGFDRKIRIPLAAARARNSARRGTGGFWINMAPTCFVDAFYPDADAVYLTYEWEITEELRRGGAKILKNGSDRNRIFLIAQRT